jgi:hypothetical protein
MRSFDLQLYTFSLCTRRPFGCWTSQFPCLSQINDCSLHIMQCIEFCNNRIRQTNIYPSIVLTLFIIQLLLLFPLSLSQSLWP